jgi:hypothetical protein
LLIGLVKNEKEIMLEMLPGNTTESFPYKPSVFFRVAGQQSPCIDSDQHIIAQRYRLPVLVP